MQISSEEVFQVKKQGRHFLCSSRKEATMYCLNNQCGYEYSFTCGDSNCECQKNHEECQSRAMIDVTLKKIKQKLNSSDNYKKEIQNQFDKIIDEISDMRDRVIKQIEEIINEQRLSLIQKRFLSFSEGQNYKQDFSNKQLIRLNKDVKIKSKIEEEIMKEIISGMQEFKSKIEAQDILFIYKLQKLHIQKQMSQDDVSFSIQRVKELVKNVTNIDKFIEQKEIQYQKLTKTMNITNISSSDRLKVKIFQIAAKDECRNTMFSALDKLKRMFSKCNMKQNIGIIFQSFFELYQFSTKQLSEQANSRLNYVDRLPKKPQGSPILLQNQLQEMKKYRQSYLKKYGRSQIQKITIWQMKQSIKAMAKFMLESEQLLTEYLIKKKLSYLQAHPLMAALFEFSSLGIVKFTKNKRIFGLNDFEKINQIFNQKEPGKVSQNKQVSQKDTNQLDQLKTSIQKLMSQVLILQQQKIEKKDYKSIKKKKYWKKYNA